MGIFNEISSQTVMAVMLVTSVLMTAFFSVLYFGIHKERSLLMLLLANILQVFIVIFLYMEKATGNIVYLMVINIVNILIVTIWIKAIFLILEVKAKLTMLLAANVINVIQALIFFIIARSIFEANIISAFLIASVSVYGVVKIFASRGADKKREVYYTTGIVGLFAILNLMRGVYRWFNPLHILTFSQIDSSAAFFLISSLGFSYILSVTIVFLNFNNLVQKVEKLNHTDALTGVLSRRTFFVLLGQKLAESKRGKRNLAIAILDIDDFKRINDTYGHLEGDKALKQFATTIKDGLRENDIIGRIGGEEFMLILEADDEKDALSALTRIKNLIFSSEWINNEKITFSVGYMLIDKDKSTMEVKDIIKIADKKMYEAKALGKDRIV